MSKVKRSKPKKSKSTKKRTEAQIIKQFPLELTLCGGKKFMIPQPMAGVISDWSEKYGEVFDPIASIKKDMDEGNNTVDVRSLGDILKSPKKVDDLFFLFCGASLDRDRVLSETPSDEYDEACKEVFSVAFPLALKKATGLL